MLIEPFAAGWMDELSVRARELPTGQRLHLLIDGAFVPGLHRGIHPDRKVMLFASLPGCSDEALDLSSFLTQFDPDDPTVQRILRRCSGWPMKGWPVPSIEYRRERWELYRQIEADSVEQFEGALKKLETSPLEFAEENWRFMSEHDPHKLKGFEGPSDPLYLAELKAGYTQTLESTKRNLQEIMEAQP